MPSLFRTHAFALAMGIVLASGACHCGGGITKSICDGKTSDNLECGSDDLCVKCLGSNQVCQVDTKVKRCVIDRKDCTVDSDCCPGQVCSSAFQQCIDKAVNCTCPEGSKDSRCVDQTSCIVKGQQCAKVGFFPELQACVFDKCDDAGACAGEGLQCFNGYCVGEAPCHGGCTAGQVCVTKTNTCFAADPSTTPKVGCNQTCAAGFILVLTEPDNIFNRCRLKDVACECKALPDLQSNDVARYSDSVVTHDNVLVSAYDTQYGDLVLHTFSRTDGEKPLHSEWIDGVPVAGAVVANPAGPRGGRSAIGQDVGRYTSIAYEPGSGTTHIAYYAVANGDGTPIGDLRYASRVGTGPWSIVTVDGSDSSGTNTGDVGMYTSITLSPEGYPVIAYFQKGGVGAEAQVSAVKIARGKVAVPASASDFVITTIESGATPPPPCNGTCASGEVCIKGGANGACQKKSTGCSPACSAPKACAIGADTNPACADTLVAASVALLPPGTGLFTGVAYIDGLPVVVWYNHTNGHLKGSIADADWSASSPTALKFSNIQILDEGADPNGKAHDVGQFASIAVAPSDASSRIAVAYFDTTTRQLKLVTAGAAWANKTVTVVDNGKGDPESDPLLFVGADTSVKYDQNKLIEIAYQDSTKVNLRLAIQTQPGSPPGTPPFTITDASSEGACGFYARLAIDGSDRFISHAIIKAASDTASANKIKVKNFIAQ